MGPMLGAIVFWIIGTQKGKASSYAVAGAILGLLLGTLGLRMGGPAAAVETTIGNLSQQEVARLVSRRRIANNFVQTAFSRANALPFGAVSRCRPATGYEMPFRRNSFCCSS